MLELLNVRKAIFFDVGYTLDRPLSGDWMFTRRFYELAGKELEKHSDGELKAAAVRNSEYLVKNHLLTSAEEEYAQFCRFYTDVSDQLGLNMTGKAIREAAYDRTYNMENYAAYPDAKNVLETLSGRFRLGVISDNWPSIETQLKSLGLYEFFSFFTFSCYLGTMKPDPKMYLDALGKSGCEASETVFIDDSVRNLKGAARLGITPVLIAANPASDVETEYTKIYSLTELVN